MDPKFPTIKRAFWLYKQSASDNQIYSTTEMKFLGVTVTKDGKKLETDLYSKPTDSHQYLHNQSCHAMSCVKSIYYIRTGCKV